MIALRLNKENKKELGNARNDNFLLFLSRTPRYRGLSAVRDLRVNKTRLMTPFFFSSITLLYSHTADAKSYENKLIDMCNTE